MTVEKVRKKNADKKVAIDNSEMILRIEFGKCPSYLLNILNTKT